MLQSKAMRVAIPQWEGRISPVFDVATNLLLVDVEDGQEVRREERRLLRTDLVARAGEFVRLGAGTLICGAISAPLEARLAAAGVRVVPFTCGKVNEVLKAYLRGELAEQAFRMPGCCHRWQPGQEMGPGPGGRGRGQGRGRGRGAGGMGARAGAGPGGACICPKCGEKSSHTSGQPCQKTPCPRCGEPMVRLQE